MKIKKLSTKLIIILITFFTSFYNVPVLAEELKENNANNAEEIITDNQVNEQEVVIEIEVVKTDENEEVTAKEETNTEVKEDVVEVEERITEIDENIDEVQTTSPDTQTESEVITDETESTVFKQDVTNDNTTISDTPDESSQTVLLEKTNGVEKETGKLEDLIQTETKPITLDNINLYILDSSDEGGCYTYRSFIYTVEDDEGNLAYYKGYLYGDGIDDDMCMTFAEAALNSDKTDVTVTDPDFVDSNKTSIVVYDEDDNLSYDYNEGYDSNHCWIKSAADVLQLTGWMKYADAGIFNTKDENTGLVNAGSYFESEDDIADYLSYCFVDDGGFQASCINWLFTGDNDDCADTLKYGVDLNDALLKSYYQDDICVTFLDLDEDIDYSSEYLDIDLNKLETDHGAIDLAVYFYRYNDKDEYEFDGAHAITLNGVIYECNETDNNTIDYTLSDVIVADPDDSVLEGPTNPNGKNKNYIVSSVSILNNPDSIFNGTYNMFNYNTPKDTSIGGSDYIKDSRKFITVENGQIKLIEYVDDNLVLEDPLSSITPATTSAIKDDYYTSTTYDVVDSLNIGLNYDFLSFYDIDDIKYELKDADGNTVKSGVFEYNKSTWNALSDSDSDFSLDFTSIIDDVGAGTYNLELTIDQDCFNGNYGWFAKKTNYYDSLADILVNMYHKQVINNNTSSNSDDDNDSTSNVVISDNKVIINSIKVVSPTETLIKNIDGTYNRQISNSNNSKIQISSLSNLIPTGTTFNQELLNADSKEYEVIKKALESDTQINTNLVSDYFAYNFDLTQSNGSEIHELDGYVEVSLPVPSNIALTNKRIVAYRVNDDGSLTKCDTKVVNNVIKFKTNHFSTYVFVVEEYKIPLTSVTSENKMEMADLFECQNLKDGSSLAWCLWK